MCLASILRLWRKTIQLLLNKTMPHVQLLPMSKVDQSFLRIHEVPPLQLAKSHIIQCIGFKLRGILHDKQVYTTITVILSVRPLPVNENTRSC